MLALGARSMDSLEKLAAEIEADGGNAIPIQIDVGSGSSVADAQAAVGEKLGDIHIVVNNAGIARSVKVLDMDDEHWQSHLEQPYSSPSSACCRHPCAQDRHPRDPRASRICWLEVGRDTTLERHAGNEPERLGIA